MAASIDKKVDLSFQLDGLDQASGVTAGQELLGNLDLVNYYLNLWEIRNKMNAINPSKNFPLPRSPYINVVMQSILGFDQAVFITNPSTSERIDWMSTDLVRAIHDTESMVIPLIKKYRKLLGLRGNETRVPGDRLGLSGAKGTDIVLNYAEPDQFLRSVADAFSIKTDISMKQYRDRTVFYAENELPYYKSTSD